jgi:hypothetical protein
MKWVDMKWVLTILVAVLALPNLSAGPFGRRAGASTSGPATNQTGACGSSMVQLSSGCSAQIGQSGCQTITPTNSVRISGSGTECATSPASTSAGSCGSAQAGRRGIFGRRGR